MTFLNFWHSQLIAYKLIFRLAQVVKITLALAIFISYGLQCYVAVDITWNDYIGKRLEGNKYKTYWESFCRTCIVLVTCKLPKNEPVYN